MSRHRGDRDLRVSSSGVNDREVELATEEFGEFEEVVLRLFGLEKEFEDVKVSGRARIWLHHQFPSACILGLPVLLYTCRAESFDLSSEKFGGDVGRSVDVLVQAQGMQ